MNVEKAFRGNVEKESSSMNYLASAVMSPNVISIFEDRDIKTAERIMTINNIRHLPVVNISNELSGIISSHDVGKARDKSKSIKTIMTSPVLIVKNRTHVRDVVEIMLKKKISSILVGNENNVTGILTTDDMLKLLLNVLDDKDVVDNYEVESFFDESWTSAAPV